MVNDYIYKRSIYSETPEGTGRAEDYRLRLSPRKASLYNTKHDNKKEARRRFLSKSSSSYLFWYLCPRLYLFWYLCPRLILLLDFWIFMTVLNHYFTFLSYVIAPCLSKIVRPEMSLFGAGIMRLAI